MKKIAINRNNATQQRTRRNIIYNHPKFCIFTDGLHDIYDDMVYEITCDEIQKIVEYKKYLMVYSVNGVVSCDKISGMIYLENTFYIKHDNISFRFYGTPSCVVAFYPDGYYYKELRHKTLTGTINCLDDFIRFLKSIGDTYDSKLVNTGTVIYTSKKWIPHKFKPAYLDMIIVTEE